MSIAKRTKMVFFLLCFYYNAVAQNEDSLISFRPNINWAFFKGVAKDDTSAAAAGILTRIKLEVVKVSVWTGKTKFKAFAVMDPSRSWVRQNPATDELLQHEQTHFNITEFCARAMQEELNQKNFGLNKKSLVEAVVAKWGQKLEQLQNQYDSETVHGTNLNSQKEWSKRFSFS